jgi:hypothetical protein
LRRKCLWLITVDLGMRTIKNVMSDVDSKVQGFKDKFAELNAAFQGRSAVQTEITVLRIMDDVQNLGAYSQPRHRGS